MIRIRFVLLTMIFSSLLASCAGPPPAPVEARSGRSGNYETTPDGYYRVRRGDNLNAIAFKFGLDWREIARLNGISSPYIIYPDQVLRLTSATSQVSAPASATQPGSSSTRVSAASSPAGTTTRALETPRSNTSAVNAPAANTQPLPEQPPSSGSKGLVVNGTQAPAGSSYKTPAGDPGRWLWPTEGKLLSSFSADDPARKGIDIGGQAGQAVRASAEGQVVYSGNGLIGYGELIIVKHSDRMLTAYAHNSKRLVSEGQQVTAGAPIAEMGTNDRNQAVLHFEIRVNGRPEDPLRYLPKR